MSAKASWLWGLALASCFDPHAIRDSRDIATEDLRLNVSSLGTAQGTRVSVSLATLVPAPFPLRLHAPDDVLHLEHTSDVAPFTLEASAYQATTLALDGPLTARLVRQQDRSIELVFQPPPSFSLALRLTTDGGEDALGVSWTNVQTGYRSTLTVEGACLAAPLSGELVADTGARQLRRSELGLQGDPAGCVLRVTLQRRLDTLVVERQAELAWTP